MIIAGGYNIYTREIDEVLYEQPKIMETCAIGIPDADHRETVKVFVVLIAGKSLTESEIIDYCKEKFAAYKVPNFPDFMVDLLKCAIVKVLKKELRAIESEKG